MNFTVLNGAALNASIEDGVGGLVLTLGGIHTAANGLAVAGDVALVMGPMRIGTSLSFAGLQLASTGTHNLMLNMDIVLAGLVLTTGGVHTAKMTIAQADADPALKMGPFTLTNGEDISIGLPSLVLGRNGFHSISAGAILPSDTTLQALGHRPLVLGPFTLSAGSLALTAGDKVALKMGGLSTRVGITAGGDTALVLGGLGTVQVTLAAGGASALKMGGVSTAVGITIGGLVLGRHGAPTIEVEGITLTAGGYTPLKLGGLGAAPTIGLRARQHFALKMGGLSVNRGNAC